MYNFKTYKFDSTHFFDIYNEFRDISKKLFSKKVSQGLRSQKRLDLGRNTFKILVLTGNRESPLDSTVAAIFSQN